MGRNQVENVCGWLSRIMKDAYDDLPCMRNCVADGCVPHTLHWGGLLFHVYIPCIIFRKGFCGTRPLGMIVGGLSERNLNRKCVPI